MHRLMPRPVASQHDSGEFESHCQASLRGVRMFSCCMYAMSVSTRCPWSGHRPKN